MSLLAEALQPSLVNGLLAVGGPLETTSLPDAITSRRAAYTLTFDIPARAIHLDFRDAAYVVSTVASDCSRLATSCLQSASLSSVDSEEKFWLPWSLVRFYYAAFYGAHAVVRLLGVGCAWLDSEDLSRVEALSQATDGRPTPFRTDPGTYRCSIHGAAGELI